MVKKFRLDSFGYEVEIGKVARQADGAVWFKQGGTVVLATVVSASTDEFPGFLPLTVDYRENFSSVGKIPGGYFKREGKSTDREVLLGRNIDRSCRPLFPANYFKQVQIIATAYSVDKNNVPGPLGFLASSLALSISKIPFLGPVGIVEVGKLDGKWVLNLSYEDTLKSDVRITFAGTAEGINMVEGCAKEISERDFLDAMFMAHEKIKEQIAWQEEIVKEIGHAKEPIEDKYQWETWEARVEKFLTPENVKKAFKEDKIERNASLDELRKEFVTLYEKDIKEHNTPVTVIDYIFDDKLKIKTTDLIDLHKRVDGRSFDSIRKITTEVGILPCTHGSALFTRGRTQALVSVTLGSGEDEQKIETIMSSDDSSDGRVMLHYNFPPFSVGEARGLRPPGRREIGHGHLALSAFKYLLPDKANFPYTIRIVADMLESDGSTSMATACGSTMALMDAGVPLQKMVSGIAMGLLMSKKSPDNFVVLSDISGFEDAFGLMDFKVVGTADGVTAIQMDIKYKGGLSRQVFEKALEQARIGRMHILGEMQKVMSQPKPTLSDLVPKFVTIKVNTDKIGAIIGTGGKTIKEIVEKTKTTIDIEPDGLVKIFGTSGPAIDTAINWIKTLSGQIDSGMIYEGKIRRIAEFGLFVELVPGKDGLVHVSNLPQKYQRTFAQHYKVDDVVKVSVLEYDDATGRVRLRLIE